jgi:hypothetical protein
MTDFILKKLEEGFETPQYRWSAMLNPAEPAAKAAIKTKAVKGPAKKKSEITEKPEKKSQAKKASGE